MCGICGMFRAENEGIGGISTTPGVCFFFGYFWHVLGREWRHLDHTRCLFFFVREHEIAVLDGRFLLAWPCLLLKNIQKDCWMFFPGRCWQWTKTACLRASLSWRRWSCGVLHSEYFWHTHTKRNTHSHACLSTCLSLSPHLPPSPPPSLPRALSPPLLSHTRSSLRLSLASSLAGSLTHARMHVCRGHTRCGNMAGKIASKSTRPLLTRSIGLY